MIKYNTEAVRIRLDRTFLEALHESETARATHQEPTPNSQQAEIHALKEELDSLYSEILPVAQMSVEQQYLEPALRKLASEDIRREVMTSKVLNYVSRPNVEMTHN